MLLTVIVFGHGKHDTVTSSKGVPRLRKKAATVYPTDANLVTACEQWLGITGTQEAELKEQPPAEEPVAPEGTPVPEPEQRDW